MGGPASFFLDPGAANVPASVYDRLMSSLSLRRMVRYLLGEGTLKSSSSRLTDVRSCLLSDVVCSTSLSSSLGGALSESVGGASLVGSWTMESKNK